MPGVVCIHCIILTFILKFCDAIGYSCLFLMIRIIIFGYSFLKMNF